MTSDEWSIDQPGRGALVPGTQIGAYTGVTASARDEAVAAFEPLFFRHMLLALDMVVCHRQRSLSLPLPHRSLDHCRRRVKTDPRATVEI